jgi:long-subunit fatty acid transport protein
MSARRNVPRARVHATRRRAAALAGVVAVVGSLAGSADATTLISPAGGARDAALAGSTVAAPSDLMSAFFQNPAGLTLMDETQATFGLGFFLISNEVRTSFGYRGDSDIVAMGPSGGIAMARGRWRFGIGIFGSVGSKFDFPADPAHGVARNFYTELAAVTIAPTVAYELTPELSVGVQINPLLGSLKNRVFVPAADQHLQWRVQGPGIQGALGLLYRPDRRWSFAVTYKTPGRIFMDGTVGVAGKREDLSFTFHVPQEVIFGAAWRPMSRLLITTFGRWHDTSAFEKSIFEFSHTPALDFPFAIESRDAWRTGVGIEVQAHPRLAIRAGAAYNTAALSSRSVTPVVYDNSGIITGGGLGIELGRWIVDLTAGIGFFDDRKIEQSEARIFGGRYTSAGPVTYAQVTRRF